MTEQMSRDEWDQLPAKERDEFISKGGRLYDGKQPPVVKPPEKTEYLISRRLYNSLSAGQEMHLNEKYRVVIID
jgi:hypothetical protein